MKSAPDIQKKVLGPPIRFTAEEIRYITHLVENDSRHVLPSVDNQIINQIFNKLDAATPGQENDHIMSNSTKGKLSMDGLREKLFDCLDSLAEGKIETHQAEALSTVAMAIIKSVEVQIEYERLKCVGMLPATLPNMPLVADAGGANHG